MGFLEKGLKRRDFLKGAAIASAAAAGLSGCQPKAAIESAPDDETVSRATAVDKEVTDGSAKWVPVACYQNCGSQCVNKALVMDGVVVRQKSDDAEQDTQSNLQQRGCLRGRSLRQQMYNVDRLKYPMKRKSWQPGGGENSHGELRGRDEWERISWEEALDYVADELKRVYRDYGPRSVVCNGWCWEPGANLLKAAGGAILNADTESFGTWGFKPEALGLNAWGDHPDFMMANDRMDVPNAEYIVLYGCNPCWSNGIHSNYIWLTAKEGGTQFAYVGPSKNVSAAVLDAKWIRVRPGTDTAFLLAVMYEMMRLDDEQGDVIDWDFLNAYTVGFDLEHMPEDAQLDECISGYVRGEYDGVPKTPEWASEICGTPAEDITWFAGVCGKNNKTMLLHSYAASRADGAENLPQAFLTVGAMGGHMGKSGHATGCMFTNDNGDSGPWLIQPGFDGHPAVENPIAPHDYIEGPDWWHSLLTGTYLSTCTGRHCDSGNMPFNEAVEMEVDMRIMFNQKANMMQSRQNLNEAVKAMRKAECCVSMDVKNTLTVQFSDIVLPLATQWEYNEDPEYGPVLWPYHNYGKQRKDVLTARFPIVQNIYETRTDEWVLRQLAQRLGIDADTQVYGIDDKTRFFDYFVNATYLAEDGETWENCFTFTEEHAQKYGVSNPPQKGAMDFDEFMEKGKFTVERHVGDKRGYIGYEDFVKDPEKNPRPSKSGKLELYCQEKADGYNVQGLNPDPIKPYANYIVPNQGYESTFEDWDNKVKGAYPLQAYTGHYLRRAHTCYDNLQWTQEAFQNPVFMNASDGADRGLVDGDTVLIRSAYGKCLRRVQLLESMIPGSVDLPHGVHSVLDETDPEDIVDRGGSEQILYGPVHSNYYHQLDNYNTVLVEIEKYDGEPLVQDFDREPFTDALPEAE